jgi:CheY-like chemotaxis protein
MTFSSERPAALVVETNYLLASVMEAPLLAAGYLVLVATNVREAFELIDQQHLKLALIDFRLKHGGPEGLVSILEGREVPYIFCTASTVEEVHEHFPGARVMLKPFSDDQLLRAVAEIAGHGSDRGLEL